MFRQPHLIPQVGMLGLSAAYNRHRNPAQSPEVTAHQHARSQRSWGNVVIKRFDAFGR